eukprot:TRINITY_DN72193_c0_g1_i1.p1 TRINITY_DN72193_c0_g1~~TRINITY_DN72193_c0_g1_i1.p1  ORF type:complete len:438 (-),score=152.86 TRINITY_DN72193_c0_g1_i1:127-1440(-)
MGVKRTRTTAQATAEGLRVFVAGVPWKIDEATLRRDFEECGVIEDFFLLKDENGYSKGRCFITFQEQDAVKAALAYDNTEYGGRKIFVKLAEEKTKQTPPKTAKASGDAAEDGEKPKGKSREPKEAKEERSFPEEKPTNCVSLCLKNIGDATDEEVRTFLKGCSVQSVRIVKCRTTGEPRGIAFVDFVDTAQVDEAMQQNGKEIKGQEVEMHYEVPKVRPRPDGCFTVAIKKLGPNTAEEDLRKLFDGIASLTAVRLIRDRQQACTGLGFAEFSEPADVEAAVRRDGMAVKGQTVFICYETKARKGAAGGSTSTPTEKDIGEEKKDKSAAPMSAKKKASQLERRKKLREQRKGQKAGDDDETDADDDNAEGEAEEAPIATAAAAKTKKRRKKSKDAEAAAASAPVEEAEAEAEAPAKRKKKRRKKTEAEGEQAASEE